MTCTACPFAFTEESERIQNYGCLPTAAEALRIKSETGKNWCCHEDEGKICAGFVQAAKELGLDYRTGALASYTSWYRDAQP